MADDTPSPEPSAQSRKRPPFSERGRDAKAPTGSKNHDRSRSRERRQRSASAADERYRRRGGHDDRKRRSVSRSEEERSRRKAPRSFSPSDDEGERRSAKRRSRSRSFDRAEERSRKHAFKREESAEQPRRRNSRERRPRDGSRDRRPRDTSRDRRPRDRLRDKSRDRKPRDRSRDRKPKDSSRDHETKDKFRDRSRDRKPRRSASPLPYRSSHKRRDRSPSPPRRHRRDSRSPPRNKRPKRSPSRSPSPFRRSRKPLPSQEISFRGTDNSNLPPSKYGGAPPDKQLPNFKPTGLLAKEANLVAGTKISLKYHEPSEARKPPSSAPWRLFIFKGDESMGTVELGSRSCWLMGRAQEVADILLGHPSSSAQHAAIQFRYIVKKSSEEGEFGVIEKKKKKGKVKPYIIDLESSNGTFLNGDRIEAGRYVELRDKDLLKFGTSEREYVVMLPPPDAL